MLASFLLALGKIAFKNSIFNYTHNVMQLQSFTSLKLHNKIVVGVVKRVFHVARSRSRARAGGACPTPLAFCIGEISSCEVQKLFPICFVELVLDSWYKKCCTPNHLLITFQVLVVRSRFLAPRGSIAEFVKGECERSFCFLCWLLSILPQFQCAANL